MNLRACAPVEVRSIPASFPVPMRVRTLVGLVVPIPTFCEVSIVKAVFPTV